MTANWSFPIPEDLIGLMFIGIVDGQRGTWYVVTDDLLVCLTARAVRSRAAHPAGVLVDVDRELYRVGGAGPLLADQ